jgi:hypothetical protein
VSRFPMSRRFCNTWEGPPTEHGVESRPGPPAQRDSLSTVVQGVEARRCARLAMFSWREHSGGGPSFRHLRFEHLSETILAGALL